jgi:hypothetical protein
MLREQAGRHSHPAATGHGQLQICLGDLQQTKQNTFLMEPNLADKNQKEKTKP